MKYRLIFLFIFCAQWLSANNDTTARRNPDFRSRRILVWSANIGMPVGVHAALYKTWYSAYPGSSFHWINDNEEWLQMDKIGHAFSGFIITMSSSATYRFAGYPRRKSAILGAAVSLGFQSAIEYFDGHSEQWGASAGDVAANFAGTIFGGVQSWLWGRAKVPLRITFHTTAHAKYRPDVLGSNLPERLLKDYNGQTYWLDFNLRKMGVAPKGWPKWLGLSIGYSPEGMYGGYGNVWTNANGNKIDMSATPRYRQFLLSPSVAFGHLKTKSKFLNVLLFITDYWRFPMPAVEFNTLKQTRLHWIYF